MDTRFEVQFFKHIPEFYIEKINGYHLLSHSSLANYLGKTDIKKEKNMICLYTKKR